MNTKELRGEEGQAAVLITLLLIFAFIALTALAIDGGHLYVVRRDLQNMSDAACLAAATELSLNKSAQEAINAAVKYIEANGGSTDLYTLPEGSGVGLVKGIEVSPPSVRVAVQRLVDTYFTMIFNRTGALVGARAHCNATAAGGLLPIAVRRFEADDDPTDGVQQRDYLANKASDPFDNPFYSPHGPGYPGDCQVEFWPGRYGNIGICLPTSPYTVTDGLVGDLQTGSIDWENLTKEGEYVGVGVLGGGPSAQIVDTNSKTPSYKGFVLLDMRNIVGPGLMEFYNGAKLGEPNTNKDISKQWFHTGYYGPNPMVGDQLAMLAGTSNDFAAQEMAQYYEVGDEFVAVVYSGYIWDNPEMRMSIEPVVNPVFPTFPSITDTVTYSVRLEKFGPWYSAASFALDWYFMEEGGAYDVITPTVKFSENPVILLQGQDLKLVNMTVYAENPITTTNYLSALTVQAEEVGIPLGLTRWASTNFRYGDVGQDFTVYASRLQYDVVKGDSIGIDLVTRGFGGFKDSNVPVQAKLLSGATWTSVFTSSSDGMIKKILNGGNTESSFTVAVRDDVIPGIYPVRLTVYPGGEPRHSVDIVVKVYSPLEAAELSGQPPKFVIVEGFAPFRVSYKDANDIWAYAIGPISQTAEELISGLNPRLLPWAQ